MLAAAGYIRFVFATWHEAMACALRFVKHNAEIDYLEYLENLT